MFAIRNATAESVRQEAVKLYATRADEYEREAIRSRTTRGQAALTEVAILFRNEANFWANLWLEPPSEKTTTETLQDWCDSIFEDTERVKTELGSPNCQVIQTEEDRARLTAYRYGYQVGLAEAAKDVAAILARKGR